MAEPRSAVLTGTVYWSDSATLFNGYVAIALGLPTNAAGTFPAVYLGSGLREATIPQWTRVRVTDGVFDQEAKLYFNADINPPSTRYFAYWYAYPKYRLFPAVGVEPAAFTITTTPYSITIPTLTLPTAPTTAPTPST